MSEEQKPATTESQIEGAPEAPAAVPVAPAAAPKKKLPKATIIGIAAAVAVVAVVGILFATKVICLHQWTETETRDFAALTTTRTVSCEACGKVQSTETEAITSLVSDGKFICSPAEFCDRFQSSIPKDCNFTFSVSEANGLAALMVQDNGRNIGLIGFGTRDDDNFLTKDRMNEANCVEVFYCSIQNATPRQAAEIIMTAVTAVHPGFSASDASQLGQRILNTEMHMEGDFAYLHDFDGDDFLISVAIA